MFASSGSSVKFWNTENFNLIQELPKSSSDVSVLSWNKDGQFLAALDQNTSEIALYAVNSKSAVCSGVLRIMENIHCLQFCNTNNRYLAVGGGKRDSVLLWDVKGNFKKKTFEVSKAGITKLSFSPTDSHLAIGTVRGDAFLVSNTNNLISGPVKLFSEKTRVKDIRYSIFNRSLVGACGENGSVILMDTNTSKVLKEFSQAHSAPVSKIAFSPINELLMISVGYDKKLVSFNANSKSIIMKCETSSPLTCVCFMGNGQSVAVGTMTGEVIVFDLRMLNSPLATVHAHKGSVHDLKLQPRGNNENKMPRSSTKNAVHLDRKGGQKSQEPVMSLSKTEQIATLKVAASQSPNLDIISPLQLQPNRDEKLYLKETPLLKNMKIPVRSMNKSSNELDDFGILSPIDKENKSPVPLMSLPSRRKPIMPTFMDGLLSPVKDSLTNDNSQTIESPLNRSSSKIEINNSVVKPILTDYFDDLLSPLKCDNSDKNEKSSKKNEDVLIPPTQITPEGKSRKKKLELETQRSSSVERVKKDLFVGCEQSLNLEVGKSVSNKENDDNCKSLEMSTNLASRLLEASLHVSTSLNDNSSTRSLPSLSFGKEEIDLNAADAEPTSSNRFSTLDSFKDIEEALQIAFPLEEISSEVKCASEIPIVPPKMLENYSAASINLELIQNCITDALERHEFEVNKRLMHIQYTMIKHFLALKKEMKKSFQEHSLNEELLLENERLRDEINRLKCTY